MSGWNNTRCGGACRRPTTYCHVRYIRGQPKQSKKLELPLLVLPPPLPGSSTSIFSSFGVLPSSSPDPSLSLPLTICSRLCGGRKFSKVLVNSSPPFALTSSRISLGGGSCLWTRLIAYALRLVRLRDVLVKKWLTQDFYSRPS